MWSAQGKKGTVAAVLLAALVTGGARSAQAGLSVSPLQQQIVVKPGVAGEFTLTLTNVARSPMTPPIKLRVEVVDFKVDLLGSISFGPFDDAQGRGEATRTGGENAGHGRSAVQWVRLDAGEVVLKPEEVRVIHGKITAPRGADGDYWAALLVTPAEPVHENGVNVILRTASALFVRAARRNYVERVAVKEADAAPPTFGEEAERDADDAEEGPPPAEGCCLTVRADIENPGLVSCTASGKAHLYLDGLRKVATIPLHARTRRVLPGESRRFIGILAAPLPAGEYSVRMILTSDSQGGQKAYKEVRFTVDDATARLWKESWQRAAASKEKAGLSVNTAEPLTVAVQPGRFTTAAIPVTNGGAGTMQVTCRPSGAAVVNGWVVLDPLTFTLGPRMRRSVLCRIAVPADAQPGECVGNVVFEAETACLTDQPGAETATLPVRIMVQK